MKKFVYLFSVYLLIATLLLPSGFTAKADGSYVTVLDHVQFTMDNGTAIAATVTLPPRGVTQPKRGFPLLILIHGWGGNRTTFEYPRFAREMAQEGYAVLAYDVRGFGESGGNAAVASERELKDLHLLMRLMLENRVSLEESSDAVYPDHIRINPQAIGTAGVSYGGGHSIIAAASNFDPATYVLPSGLDVTDPQAQLSDPIKFPKVAAIAPIVGWSDLNDALFPNRVFKLSYGTGLSLLSAGRADPILYEWLTAAMTGVNEQKVIEDLKSRSVLYEGHFTNKQGVESSLKNVPIYFLQSWEDYLFPAEQAISLYNKLKSQNPNLKLYLGNTGHPPASLATDSAEAEYMFSTIKDWFNYWLKGAKKANPFEKGKVVVAPEPGAYTDSVTLTDWKANLTYFEDIPKTTNLTLYLNQNKKLTTTKPGLSVLPDTIVSNPLNGFENDPIVSFAQPIGDITGSISDLNRQWFGSLPVTVGNAYYTSDVLTEDVGVFGHPLIKLYAASTGLNVHLITKIYDVAPDGKAFMTTRGVSRFEQFSQLIPQKSTFTTFSDYHVFKKGHRIVIEVGAVDFPFYKIEPANLFVNIHHSGSKPSHVVLPSLNRR